jgi:glycosyltransferase involved in cell wall biosynthesis
MRIGIDASNLRAGGGLTHLIELLRSADPQAHGFDQVTVWAGAATLAKLERRQWLRCVHDPLLDRSLPYRVYWQRLKLPRLAQQAGCDVLFVPGGSDASGFRPMVTMSRNMLPFEKREARRYGWSWMRLKLALLRYAQSRTLREADGAVYLTRYARDTVLRLMGGARGQVRIVPHGISSRFFLPPRRQRAVAEFTRENPCRILYVSIVDLYKHQWHVADAVSRLRSAGVPVELELVGPLGRGASKLRQTLDRVDPDRVFVRVLGALTYEQLPARYAAADLGVFASSCENMPNILLEGMAAGLPLACSSKGPMPEILGEAGVYFDPEDPDDIARAIRRLIDSPQLRAESAEAAFRKARGFSWERCANDTFAFLATIVQERHPAAPPRSRAMAPIDQAGP